MTTPRIFAVLSLLRKTIRGSRKTVAYRAERLEPRWPLLVICYPRFLTESVKDEARGRQGGQTRGYSIPVYGADPPLKGAHRTRHRAISVCAVALSLVKVLLRPHDFPVTNTLAERRSKVKLDAIVRHPKGANPAPLSTIIWIRTTSGSAIRGSTLQRTWQHIDRVFHTRVPLWTDKVALRERTSAQSKAHLMV